MCLYIDFHRCLWKRNLWKRGPILCPMACSVITWEQVETPSSTPSTFDRARDPQAYLALVSIYGEAQADTSEVGRAF